MKTTYTNPRGRTSLDSMMTPMIDVVFLLLVFFLTTASFQRPEKLLPGAVSAESHSISGQNDSPMEVPPVDDLSDCVIKIRLQEGKLAYRWNDVPVESLEALRQRIAATLQVRADIPIIVDPEDDVLAGDALRVYDIAKRFGALSVFMVAR
jgi:biopolymer transport protein ExbD